MMSIAEVSELLMQCQDYDREKYIIILSSDPSGYFVLVNECI